MNELLSPKNDVVFQKGIEKEKISNAKNLLKLGVDVDIVAKGTLLSIEEVIELKNDIGH